MNNKVTNIQTACEVLEDLIETESSFWRKSNLTAKQFMALNVVLMELQVSGKYELPKKYKTK